MDPDDTFGSGFATRRSLLKTIGVGSAAATVGISPLAASGAGAQVCSGPVPTELIGRFVDTFGHRHIITETHWQSFHDDEEFFHRICSVQPQDGFLITRNHASQAFHPNKFSRFEWLVEDGDLWYCQQVFSAASAEEAADFDRFPAAHGSDPSGGGCGDSGGFAWTKLMAEPS